MTEKKYIAKKVKNNDNQPNVIYIATKEMELKEIYSILQEMKFLDFYFNKEITLCIK